MNICKISALLFIFTLSLFNLDSITAQAWEELSPPPFLKHHSNGFGFNGKAYIFEGTFQENRSNEVWEYTPETDNWVRLPDFPGDGRSIAIGDDWNGKYYYGFGNAGGSIGLKNDLWVFDPVDTSFTQLPSCPCQGRTHPALIAHNDKIYMGSGSTFNGDLNDWWEYDMITQEWTQKQDMPGGPRHHPFFFAEGNSVFVGGGHVFNWLKYDLDDQEWSFIDDFPEGRVAGSQFSYDGYGFLLGGDDAAHVHVPDWQTFMRYNPQTDEWELLPALPNGSRWANSSFIIEDNLYYFGGLSDLVSGDNSMWKFDLTLLDCLPLQNMSFSSITDSTANLFWNSNPNAESDTLKWRKLGSTEWIEVPNPQATLVLEGLETCEEYEVLFVTTCGGMTTYSEIFDFRTKGCCNNPSFTVGNLDDNTTAVDWVEFPGANAYEIRYRPAGAAVWSVGTSFNNSFEIKGLFDCRQYEIQIRSICFVEDNDFSESAFFYSPGCGACLDQNFCPAPSTLQGIEEYIDEVKINSYVNTSGSDNGYGNYAVPDLDPINRGTSFSLSVKPVFNTTPLDLKVWIDFNADGNFDAAELVLANDGLQSEITEEIDVPLDAMLGISRMRVMYGKAATGELDPCNSTTEFVGEAEDYCINISGTTNTSEINQSVALNLTAQPNPFKDVLHLQGEFVKNNTYNLTLINLTGQRVLTFEDYSLNQAIDLSIVPAGVYFLSVDSIEGHQQIIRIVKD